MFNFSKRLTLQQVGLIVLLFAGFAILFILPEWTSSSSEQDTETETEKGRLTFLELETVFGYFEVNKNTFICPLVNQNDELKDFCQHNKRFLIKHLIIEIKSKSIITHWNETFSLNNLKILTLRNSLNSEFEIENPDKLVENSSIETLIFENMNITKSFISLLNKLTNVKIISFQSCSFEDFLYICNAGFVKNIHSLQLYDSKFGFECFKGLSNLANLKILSLKNNRNKFENLNDDHINYLEILGNRITTLNLENVAIESQYIKIILSKFTKLVELGLILHPFLEFDENIFDKSKDTLEVLSVFGCHMFNFESISKLQKLVYLNINYAENKYLIYDWEKAKQNNVYWGKTLEILSIGSFYLEYEILENIISFCSHLKILKLLGNTEICNSNNKINLKTNLNELEVFILINSWEPTQIELPYAIINSCLNLKTLMIFGIVEISSEKVPEYNFSDYLSNASRPAIVLNKENLNKIFVSDSLQTLYFEYISDLDINQFREFVSRTEIENLNFKFQYNPAKLSKNGSIYNRNRKKINVCKKSIKPNIASEYKKIQERRQQTAQLLNQG